MVHMYTSYARLHERDAHLHKEQDVPSGKALPMCTSIIIHKNPSIPPGLAAPRLRHCCSDLSVFVLSCEYSTSGSGLEEPLEALSSWRFFPMVQCACKILMLLQLELNLDADGHKVPAPYRRAVHKSEIGKLTESKGKILNVETVQHSCVALAA